MKSISVDLANHIQQRTTSLASCWYLKRTDGKEFFFTDHDVDIIFDGDTYEASSGYNRSSIANNSNLAVDNTEVDGVFDSGQITVQELEAGLFDFAEIRMFLINWQDTSQGILKMRRGFLGEVSSTLSGFFHAEFRGLSQLFSQEIGELTSPECRAHLGDDRCKLPIDPNEVQRTTNYAVGDYVKVPTAGLSSFAPITNGGFETGDLTGWTITSVDTNFSVNGNFPKSGSFSLNTYQAGQAPNPGVVEQTVDCTSVLDETEVDAGNYTLDFSIWSDRADTTSGTFRLLVEFLDASDNFISDAYDTGVQVVPESGGYDEYSIAGVPVPALTRGLHITVTLVDNDTDGGDGVSVDDISGFFNFVGTEFYDVYENRIYQCTTAGQTADGLITYDTTVGNTTTDGTAEFVAEEAWSRHAEVDTATDRMTFTLTNLTESRAVDDWFNGGGLKFEDGENAGRTIEIKDWVQSSSEITLHIEAPFDIVPGTKVVLFPGCDWRLETCRDKFDNVINRRAEDFTPGLTALTWYPDAQ